MRNWAMIGGQGFSLMGIEFMQWKVSPPPIGEGLSATIIAARCRSREI
jgi:hypothetical protein